MSLIHTAGHHCPATQIFAHSIRGAAVGRKAAKQR